MWQCFLRESAAVTSINTDSDIDKGGGGGSHVVTSLGDASTGESTSDDGDVKHQRTKPSSSVEQRKEQKNSKSSSKDEAIRSNAEQSEQTMSSNVNSDSSNEPLVNRPTVSSSSPVIITTEPSNSTTTIVFNRHNSKEPKNLTGKRWRARFSLTPTTKRSHSSSSTYDVIGCNRPVCGANGRSYWSACVAKCHGLNDDDLIEGRCSDHDFCDDSPCDKLTQRLAITFNLSKS